MQDSAMLNAKPKLSIMPGTLCFIAAGRNMEYCIFYVSFLGDTEGVVVFDHCFRVQFYFFFLIH